MEFKVGLQLEVNKDFPGVAEVCGLYPRGQSGYHENHWQIMMNGFRITLPESVITTMFREIRPELVQVEEVAVEAPKPVAPEVKTIKKLTKKNSYTR